MFAQMKSRSRPSRPCPCQGTCECHTPDKDSIFPGWIPFFFPIFFPIIVPTLIPGLLILMLRIGLSEPTPHIQVNGQDCTVQTITDHCTSTGACTTHEVAICPEK